MTPQQFWDKWLWDFKTGTNAIERGLEKEFWEMISEVRTKQEKDTMRNPRSQDWNG